MKCYSTLDECKSFMWEDIKAERDRRKYEGGAKVGELWWLSTRDAIGEYNSLLSIAARNSLPGTYVMRAAWRSMSGVTQDMTPNLASQILMAGFALFAAIDDAAQAHGLAMEQSADPAGYDFSGGWPAIYGQ